MDDYYIGELVNCFDGTDGEFIGVGAIEEYYGNNVAWCIGENLNYWFIISKIKDE